MGKYKNENKVKFWVFMVKKVGKYKNFLGQNFYACPRSVHFTLLMTKISTNRGLILYTVRL